MPKVNLAHAVHVAVRDVKEGRLTAEQALQALDLLLVDESPFPAVLEADRVAERWVSDYEVANGVPI